MPEPSDRLKRFDEGEWAPGWLRSLARPLIARPPKKTGATDPKSQNPGCLGTALGELFACVALGLVVLLAVGLVEGLRALSAEAPIAGLPLAALAVVLFLYGAIWTVRVRPGLYLEHLRKADAESERRSALVGDGRVRTVRLVAMGFLQFGVAAICGFVLFWILFS